MDFIAKKESNLESSILAHRIRHTTEMLTPQRKPYVAAQRTPQHSARRSTTHQAPPTPCCRYRAFLRGRVHLSFLRLSQILLIPSDLLTSSEFFYVPWKCASLLIDVHHFAMSVHCCSLILIDFHIFLLLSCFHRFFIDFHGISNMSTDCHYVSLFFHIN